MTFKLYTYFFYKNYSFWLIPIHSIIILDIDSDPNRAPPCDRSICKLPDCFCSEDGTQVPGELCKVGPAGSECENVPQMITVTFDDAINNNNIDLYSEIFNRQRKNPNGCDIKSTFFVCCSPEIFPI